MSDSKLEGLGYSEEAIQNLKSLGENPTENQLAAASSNLTINVYAGVQHGHNSSLSWAVYYMTWAWSSQPVWNEKDMVAIAWSEGMYLTPSSESSFTHAYVNYYNDSDGSFWNKEYYSTAITPDLNRGASVTFSQGKSVGGYPTTVWAKSGAMEVKLTKQANVPEMCVQVAYGHSVLSGTPSVSFSVSGSGASASVGISFSWFMKSVASDYLYQSL